MAAIDPIFNGESGAAVRAKLNELIDTVNSGSQTINIGDAPLFDPDKTGGYEAGSIISYKNESSPDEEFHEFAIYIALTDIPQGVSPEDSPNWKNEGATVEVAGGNTANGVVQDITRLRELTGMRTGHTVAVQAEGAIYVFDEGSEAGIKPFAPGIGSWVKRYEFSEMGGGHTFEDSTGTALPARSVAKAGAGIEFEDDAVNEMTVVRVDESLTDHIDGADEEKHTTNQIIQQLELLKLNLPANSPLHTILQSIDNFLATTLNVNAIDVTDPSWLAGEQRLVTVEKTIDSEPELKGATQLVDLVLPPSTVAALESPSGWVGERRTLTGANFFGELGRVGCRGTGADGTIYICEAALPGTQGNTDGSATFVRNRSVDALNPDDNANDNDIANLLDPTRIGGNLDDGWDTVNNVKIISTLVCRVGTWFTQTQGYFYTCFHRTGTSYYWRRIGQPISIQRPINDATKPNITTNLLAHDFTTGNYTGTPGDEVTYQDQTFYDEVSRRLFWQVKSGIWEEIQLVK